MSARDEDRGMKALERVRDVREQDSRVGLTQSIEHRTQRLLAAERADHRLAAHPAFAHGSGADLAQAQRTGARMAEAAVGAHAEAATAERLAEEARGRWQQDRTRLRTVELLLERRADLRSQRRRRAEDRELDDVAGQGWLRRRGQR